MGRIAIPRRPATWRDLPTPSPEHLAALADWLDDAAWDRPEQAYWLSGADRDIDYDGCYCPRHAEGMRRKLAAIGVEVYVSAAWAGDDSALFCRIVTCGARLDGGGVTDYGVDSCLGITEEDPLGCGVGEDDLWFAQGAMTAADARWKLWAWHAEHLRCASPEGLP